MFVVALFVLNVNPLDAPTCVFEENAAALVVPPPTTVDPPGTVKLFVVFIAPALEILRIGEPE